MINNLNRFRRLAPGERRLLMQALLLLPLTAMTLRLFGLRKCQHVLGYLTLPNPARIADEVTAWRKARRIAGLVNAAASRGILQTSCLPRSLTLWGLLRRQGIESALRIGVRREAGTLEAHAWVELMGRALNESEDLHERFAAFARPILSEGSNPQ